MQTVWAISLAVTAVALLIARVVRVRQVRFKRVDDLHKKYAHLVDDPSRMTYIDAQDIMRLTAEYDMPFTVTVSLSFALFKTYAVPTISAVLCKSKELACPMLAGRRAEDTAVVIAEFADQGLDSERGSKALARMNWLHSRFGNLITRDDKLLTLCQFIFEPTVLMGKYEWRKLTPLEDEARYVFWREVGARMNITDIPPTMGELKDWLDDYTEKNVYFHPNNQKVGDATFYVMLRPIPSFLHPFAKLAAAVFLDDRTREAFGYKKTPLPLAYSIMALLQIKGWINGYLSMPRKARPVYGNINAVQSEKGTKYQREGFLFEPWYTSPKASWVGALGFGKPGAEKWYPEGFTQETLGPERLRNQGVEETLAAAAKMREQSKNGACPFYVSQNA